MKKLFLDFIQDKELLRQLWIAVRVAWSALGVVYIFGRMLNIIKTPLGKNRLAVFVMIFNISGFVYFENICDKDSILQYLWTAYLYFTICITFYVWFFWKAYDRIDTVLDHKGFKDKVKYFVGKRGKKK